VNITALMDITFQPSTIFAANYHFAGPKQIKVWQFNDHVGGYFYQTIEKVKFWMELAKQ
jgi:cephalosporin-C deacetylase